MGASREITSKIIRWLKLGDKPQFDKQFVLITIKLAIGGTIYRLSV